MAEGKIRVMMDYDDGNASASTVDTFHDGLRAAREWLNEWTEAPSSEAVPGITAIHIERVA